VSGGRGASARSPPPTPRTPLIVQY